ncbi:hybrid sensor histidine kinase/response regulator [Noviherbaspirillum sp.]|uniref:hybrid sensor histidine kinase/response regulator n=1 Tax=Noviherbaspirillum sp. TaxID=1926288 RepID=UPI002D6A35D4|nr:ATP-binding protein [Noviherbaspirillum sp.]HZW20499.1 ATP-binding protein [Noviherbaspirillum sp.]
MKSRKPGSGADANDSLREVLRSASAPLIALLAFAILLPVLLAAWFGWHHYGRVLEEAENTAQRSVVALQEHAANVLDSHALALYQVAGITDGRSRTALSTDRELQRTLSDLTARFEQISDIGVTDADGRLIASSAGASYPLSFAEHDFFIAQKSGIARGMFFSEAYAGKPDGRSQFAISIARTNPAGAFDGIIFASVPVDYFTKFWEQFVPSRGYLVPFIREDGVLLTRYPAANNPTRLNPNGPFVSRIRHSPSGIYTAKSQVDGIERINAYSRVKAYPLYISYSIEKRNVLRKWREDMAPGLFMALLVIAVLTFLWVAVVRQSFRQRAATAQWRNVAAELESEIRRRENAEEALRHGQKMDALGQIAGGIAHDFNNLLTGIAGNLTLTRVHLEKGRLDAVARSVKAADSVVGTASAITHRLLAFSRRDSLAPSVININDRIVLMQDMILATVGPSITVRLSLAEDLWNTLCDPNQLDTALLNLAINARDAMENGGELELVTENLVLDATAPEHAIPPGRYAVLSVRDTGKGMPPDVIERAFEPFFTTKPKGQGTGLGLSMIYGFVQEARGEIRLHSAEGAGTTVKIYLPRRE